MTHVSILPQDEFHAKYKKAFAPANVPTDADKKALREAISCTQQLIVDALKQFWSEPNDFEVGWDFDYCFHVCGGIYSDRIVCREYVAAIASALEAAPHPSRWTYHTACETDTVSGEFFIRNGVLYVSEDADPQLREKLGCVSRT